MEEHNASKQFLHVVTHQFVIMSEICIHLWMRAVNLFLFPFAAFLDETLACDIFHKVLIVSLIFVKELVRESFHIESLHYVICFYVAPKFGELFKVFCCSPARLVWTK